MRSTFLALAFLASAAFSGVVTDANLGIAITLPPHWSKLNPKPAQDYFRDSTKQYRSQISIVKYDINPADYPTPESWTQAQFIAYLLSVATSAFPFGTVAYYDSSAAAKLGAHWSPEAYSVLYPADGDPTYCEYVRYCAVGTVGYEIYAIGDSTDMTANVDYYAGIIASLQFSAVSGIPAPAKPLLSARVGIGSRSRTFDLAGRRIPDLSLLPGSDRPVSRQRLVRPSAP
ncbi:MAG TPA: hypothetical protein VJ385_00250 [Fibrobacteria bacterium]|nr:hypothetical protein [Fibrobacteria bacterium]